ncbi:MAG: SH3 domain-containing protein [Sphingobacteriia bacterium]|nr:SH3 domain-containing protein [Sphingobacteriia bacterium]
MSYNILPQSGSASVKVRLNIREQPSASSTLLGTLEPNTKLTFDAVVNNGDSINGNAVWYRDLQGHYLWSGGVTEVVTSTAAQKYAASALPPILPPGINLQNLDLPVTNSRCIRATQWLKNNFGTQINSAITNTQFPPELLYAIACQETAIYWIKWIDDQDPAEILGRCIFDASGDINGSRSVFPRNTAAFIERFGQDKADLLIKEANITRAWRGWGEKQWVYAGYGIFQYDLQFVLTDPDFFFQKKWYNIEDCITKVVNELQDKQQKYPNDLFNIVKAYNGSGTNAINYARNVFQFLEWIGNGV